MKEKIINKFHQKVADWSSEFFELDSGDNVTLKHRMNYQGKTLIFNLIVINEPIVWTKGVYNRCPCGKYSVFIDYDYMKIHYLKGELRHLQEIFHLGNVHIFQSSKKGYHAVFLIN